LIEVAGSALNLWGLWGKRTFYGFLDLMPNGKIGDNPLSDMTIHDAHPFPLDIEVLLRRVDKLGRGPGRWPLGENWPYSPREFDWARGHNLDEARKLLSHLLLLLEEGRGDEVLIDPRTGKPFRAE
jgi:hypothetical protein